jgi:cysteine-rich repeat protein
MQARSLKLILPLTACALCVLWGAGAHAEDLSEGFDSPLIDPRTFNVTTPDGFDVTVTSGKAVFTKSAGTGNGFARMNTVFLIEGDFVVTVVADRVDASGNAEIGLATNHVPSGTGFTDIFFRGTGQVNSNIFVDPVHSSMSLNEPSTQVTFRITRIGNRLVHQCDPGSGFIEINEATDPALAGPVEFSLFLGQEDGNTAAHSATFDDWSMIGDVFSSCGNGLLEEGEACDDGNPAWMTGEYCDESCAVLACGDADDSGAVTATDALIVLRTSVNLSSCDACVCDVDSSGGATPTTASDALRVLQRGVGLPSALVCPFCL